MTKTATKGILITDKQFGKKIGKHAKDYGLDPSKKEDRVKMEKIIYNIVNNNDKITDGEWRGQVEDVKFYIKDEDVVVTKQTGAFITILKEGIANERVKKSRE